MSGVGRRLLSVVSVFVIVLLIAQIFYPVVFASVVYGPVTFDSDGSGEASFHRSFDVNDTGELLRLYLRSNFGVNASDNVSLMLNGGQVLSGRDLVANLTGVDVNLSSSNLLDLIVNNSWLSSYTMWIENGTPGIKVLMPATDSVSDDSILLSGLVQDLNSTFVTLANGTSDEYIVPGPVDVTVDNNGVVSVVQAEGGYFSTMLNVSSSNNVTVSFTDATGTLRSASLLLDGDYLNQSEELALGFDPLDSDSDCSLTIANEGDNGVPDGLETFGGDVSCTLPVFVKSRLGADPFLNDTDGDGLSDYYEVMKLIPFTSPASGDTDNDGVTDGLEDVDNDTLTNMQEYLYGTNPLNEDSDGDGLNDNVEVSFGSDPLVKDSDGDGLRDDSEYRLGTLPDCPDSDSDGVLDGLETYTSIKADEIIGVTVTAFGTGDVAANVTLYNETSVYFLAHSALISDVVNVSVPVFGEASVSFSLDEDNVSSHLGPVVPSKMMVCRYNETVGMYLPLDTTVEVFDEVSDRYVVSAVFGGSGLYGCFNASNYSEVFRSIVEANYGTCNVANTVYVSLDGNVSITVLQGQQGLMSMSAMSGGSGMDSDYGGGTTSDFNALPAPQQLSLPANPGGYSYFKEHSLSGSSDGSLSGYAVRYVLHSGSGVDNGLDVFLNGHSLAWPYDFRFVDADGNVLSYWIESYNSSTATVWVKQNIAIEGSSVFLYYGKPGDAGVSSGDAIFQFFDDFNDLSRWNTQGSVSVSGGVVSVTSNSYGWSQVVSNNTFSDNQRLIFKLRTAHSGYQAGLYEQFFSVNDLSTWSGYECANYAHGISNYANRYEWRTNGQTPSTMAIGAWTSGAYHVQTFSRHGQATGSVDYGNNIDCPSTNYDSTAQYIGFRTFGPGGGINIDYVFTTAYVQDEPDHVTWTNEQATITLPDPNPGEFLQDTDNDGLPDHVELEGFLDDHGIRHNTNVSCNDTDGDGLLDNEEVQYAAISGYNSGNYNIVSYPDDDDSDNDGLDDYEESIYYDTKPLSSDSDGDLLPDGYELSIWTDPLSQDTDKDGYSDTFEVAFQHNTMLTFNPIVKDMKIEDRMIEFGLGAACGEWLADGHGNEYYLAGWMFSGMIPYLGELGDIRDLCASDSSTVVLNAAAVWLDAAAILLPPAELLSMASSGLTVLAKFVIHNPDQVRIAIAAAGMILSQVHFVNSLAEIRKVATAEENEFIDLLLNNYHVPERTIIEWGGVSNYQHIAFLMQSGASKEEIQYVIDSLKEADCLNFFNEVIYVGRDENLRVFWLQTGNGGYGLVHLLEHLKELNKKAFNGLTEEEFMNMIYATVNTGDRYPIIKNGIITKYVYVSEFVGNDGIHRFLHVVTSNILGSNGGKGIGNIITSYHSRTINIG